jgi:hypothetical protein
VTLEEKLRALAAKGELVHLSIAFIGNEFRAAFCSASAKGNYGFGAADDPVTAVEMALKANPIRLRCAPPGSQRAAEPENEITATVKPERDGALNSEWTTP